MFAVDMTRLATRQFVFQCFGLACAFERLALDFSDQLKDSYGLRSIVLHPPS